MSRTLAMEQSNYKRVYCILETSCKWNFRRRRLCLLWRLWLWWRSYSQFEHLEIPDKLTRCKEDSNWISLLSAQKQVLSWSFQKVQIFKKFQTQWRQKKTFFNANWQSSKTNLLSVQVDKFKQNFQDKLIDKF